MEYWPLYKRKSCYDAILLGILGGYKPIESITKKLYCYVLPSVQCIMYFPLVDWGALRSCALAYVSSYPSLNPLSFNAPFSLINQ